MKSFPFPSSVVFIFIFLNKMCSCRSAISIFFSKSHVYAKNRTYNCHTAVPKASHNNEHCGHKFINRAKVYGLSFTGFLGFEVGFWRCLTTWHRFGICIGAQRAKHFYYIFLRCTVLFCCLELCWADSIGCF